MFIAIKTNNIDNILQPIIDNLYRHCELWKLWKKQKNGIRGLRYAYPAHIIEGFQLLSFVWRHCIQWKSPTAEWKKESWFWIKWSLSMKLSSAPFQVHLMELQGGAGVQCVLIRWAVVLYWIKMARKIFNYRTHKWSVTPTVFVRLSILLLA